jgi:hypothetical protein
MSRRAVRTLAPHSTGILAVLFGLVALGSSHVVDARQSSGAGFADERDAPGAGRRAPRLIVLPIAVLAGSAACGPSAPPPPGVETIPFSEAQSIVAAMRQELPAGLAGKSDAEIAAAWPGWASARDAEIRARLAQGDEDSVVHLWLFGTSFTTRPRATEALLARIGRDASLALVRARLDDFIAGIQSPGGNDRLQVARQVLERAGIDVTTAAGRAEAARHLEGLRVRQAAELAGFSRETDRARERGDGRASLDAYLTYYQARGLSSDTSLLAMYSVARALQAAAAAGWASPRSVRRVAVVGPGLDFVDNAEGLDVYPEQTLQPFAVVDSLARLGLAHQDGVDVTTFDISPRVVSHLSKAAREAARDAAYVVHLPLEDDTPEHAWDPAVVSYWQRFGAAIGEETAPGPLPDGLRGIRVRAIRVHPKLVASVRSIDLNIVLERPGPRPAAAFDLIVATNILVYYPPFEQALALSNVAAMLTPGGLFLTNTLTDRLPILALSVPMPIDVAFDRQGGGDTLQWFRRPAE